MPKDPQSFCSAPWQGLYLDTQGDYRVCCISRQSLGSSSKHSVEEVYQGEAIQSLRETFLSGALPLSCRNCYLKEDQGLFSQRMTFSDYHDHGSDQFLITEASPSQILHLDVALTNLCNLSCEYCEPINSTGRQRTLKAFAKKGDDGALYSKLWNNQFGEIDQSSRLLETINRLGPHLKHIDFKGGEPFLSKHHKKILKELVPYANQIVLSYNTNGTLFDPELQDLWRPFKKIELIFSIDAIGDLFSYIRKGQLQKNKSSHRKIDFESVIEANLEKYAQFDGPIEISIHNTLSAFNILHLADFYHWWKQKNQMIPLKISFGTVSYPTMMGFSALPSKLKELAVKRLGAIPFDSDHKDEAKFSEVLSALKKSQHSPHDFELLKRHIKNSDQFYEDSLIAVSQDWEAYL